MQLETIKPRIEPELIVRLVEAVVKAKTEALETEVARVIMLWSHPPMIAKMDDQP